MVNTELTTLIERLKTLNPQWAEKKWPGETVRTATLSNGMSLQAYITNDSAGLTVRDEEGREVESISCSKTVRRGMTGAYNNPNSQGFSERSPNYDSAVYLSDWLRPQFDAVDSAKRAREDAQLQESRRRLYGS